MNLRQGLNVSTLNNQAMSLSTVDKGCLGMHKGEAREGGNRRLPQRRLRRLSLKGARGMFSIIKPNSLLQGVEGAEQPSV